MTAAFCPRRFLSFLDSYGDFLSDEDVLAQDALPILAQIAQIVKLFARIGFEIPEKMKPLYKYVETLPHSKVDAETAIQASIIGRICPGMAIS